MNERPHVTVTLSGKFRDGKSVVAGLLRQALTDFQIEVESDAHPYSDIVLAGAARHLKTRNLKVTILEVHERPTVQIDATVGIKK